MRLSSVLVSFSFFLINFLLPFVEGTSSGNGNSAVSFTLCDDFTWEQGRHFSLQVASKTDPNALTARFGEETPSQSSSAEIYSRMMWAL